MVISKTDLLFVVGAAGRNLPIGVVSAKSEDDA